MGPSDNIHARIVRAMDAVRQVRFATAPFFLYGSLLLGALLTHRLSLSTFKDVAPELIVGIGAALIASTLPIGFLIGAISILVLRLAFRAAGRQSYEVTLRSEAWSRVWSRLHVSTPFDTNDAIYAGVTFDHEILSPGVHDWIVRRWTAFNISTNSVTALLLAHTIAPLMYIPQTLAWWLVTGPCVSLLSVNAVVAWKHTMRMVDFQSRRLSVVPPAA